MMELLALGRAVIVVAGDTVVHTVVRTPTSVAGKPLGAHRGEAYFLVEHRHGLETRRFDYTDEGVTWSRDTSVDGERVLRAAALLHRSAQPRDGFAAGFAAGIEGMLRRPIT